MVILRDPDRSAWLRFGRPVRICAVKAPGDLERVLRDVEGLVRTRGWHAVGFVTYEAAAAYDLAVHRAPAGLPLAWFGLYPPAAIETVATLGAGTYDVSTPVPSISLGRFLEAVEQIKRHIGDGDTYQVNFTFALEAAFAGDTLAFFADLAAAQAGRYAAYVDLGSHVICSASPELFFARDGRRLLARPMKGTAARGRTPVGDRGAAEALARSPKDRAENVMIVDMVRNDLGRVADVGSVTASDLFRAERYPTVWQLTSSVEATSGAALPEIVAALHPSASVTGAPKVRTMQLIRDLEPEPRGVYTGAIGHLRPTGDCWFSVAIRTAVIDRDAGRLRFGVGSGIVWDSDPLREHAECLLKGEVLRRRPIEFELLETLRWDGASGYVLLERHLRRMQDSAEYFGFPWPAKAVEAELQAAAASAGGAARVRVLVSRDGGVRTEGRALEELPPRPLRVGLARTPVDRSDVFLYHKTTHRTAYARARAERPDCDETLLWNDAGEITEAANWNVVVERGGVRVTPPVSSGLLAGTLREELLARGELQESPVTAVEVRAGARLWLINSVRGWRDAVLAPD